jgi:hypothetical protein
MEQQFKSNTHHAKKAAAIDAGTGEKKEIKKVVKGIAKTKSKSKIHKLTDIFVSEDASNVKSYLVSDILVPMVKKGIMGALDMMLNGGHVNYDGSRRSTGARVSYGGFFDDARNTRRDDRTPRVRFDYDDIEYPTKGDAEAVLDGMYDALNNYGFVSVGDMYDMSDITAPHTANRFGWYKLQGAHTARSGSGYIIVLPKAVPRN